MAPSSCIRPRRVVSPQRRDVGFVRRHVPHLSR
uniref:Uncharacterized protein n=1 Tax=Anguilla anguilla TaxID=7936 RepID=A0A0E9TDT8_ANGAN